MSVLKIKGADGNFHSVLTIQGADGYTPVKGVDYSDGADGKSAYEVAVEQGFVGTEAEWLTSLHGADGKDGKDGQNGADGKDGVDGEKGGPGESGVYIGTDEPTEANVWIDPSGEPTSMVEDVQINGTSIVADGVANIPLVSADTSGVISKFDKNFGIGDGESVTGDAKYKGVPVIYPSNNTNISNRTQGRQPIVPTTLDYAVKAAMCDGKGAEWTAEEQAMARVRMGADGGTMELLVDAVLEEDAKTFVVQIPKSCEEIIYHTWTFNDSGANLAVRHYVGDDSLYCLARYAALGTGSGISTNGFAKHIGNIENYSIVGYSTYSISSNWTSDNNGNGASLYMTYPHDGVITKISRFKMTLDTGVLKAGTVIRIWGR